MDDQLVVIDEVDGSLTTFFYDADGWLGIDDSLVPEGINRPHLNKGEQIALVKFIQDHLL